MPPRALLTLVTAATVALGAADFAAAATVVRVIDGDTVKLRDGQRTRTVDLLGVDAPEPGACHAADAKKALQQLLPAKAKVRQQADGKRKGRYVYRGGTLVNAALLRAGAARATALDDLAKASQLTTAEQAAKTANRGLWKACPAPPQPQPTPAPPAGTVVTGEEAKQRAIKDLQGRAFIHITTTTFSSAESRLHLCSDGSYVEEVSTYSDFGGSTAARYTGRWEVLNAEYRGDNTARASVRRLNDDGTIGFVEFAVVNGGQVTVNGNVVSVATSGVCG